MADNAGFGIDNDGNGTPDSPILDRMRKLLAKAENAAATEHERAALLAKVAELSAKYGVDAAQAGSRDDEMGLKEYEVSGDFTDQAAELIYWVAEALGCKSLLTWEGVTVVGYLPDMERADILATSLGLQMNSGAVRVDGPDSVVKGWMKGFTDTVVARLRDAEARARRLADQDKLRERQERLMEIFKEEFPNTVASRRSVDRTGYAGGANAGRTADIGQSRMGGRRREIA
jgi:hypothetical protein